jgi:sugar phosphate isomerase/epimerase
LTNPQLVGFALDTGHALHAGKDPAALIGVLGKRLGVIHFADYSDQGSSGPGRPPLGEGRLNIPAAVAALRKVDFDQWIVLEEQTVSATGRPMAERGLAVLRTAFRPAK